MSENELERAERIAKLPLPPSHLAKKKKKKKASKEIKGIVIRPPLIQNRFIFREQLTANGYDLVGEIVKNIKLIKDPKEQLLYQMRLMAYAYAELEPVQIGIDSRGHQIENGIQVIDVEPEKEDFETMIRRV